MQAPTVPFNPRTMHPRQYWRPTSVKGSVILNGIYADLYVFQDAYRTVLAHCSSPIDISWCLTPSSPPDTCCSPLPKPSRSIRLFNQGTQFPAHPPLQETSARLTMTSPVPFTTSTHCPNVAPQHQIPHSLAPRPQCWSLLVLPSQYLSLQRSLILGNILGHIRKLSDGGVGTFYAYFHCQPYTLLTVIRASPYNQQWVAETTHRPSTLTQYAQASPPV